MAGKLLNTILYFLLFLLALLIVIRYIRSEEGFANPTYKEETYDLNLFFKNYPLQRICEIYNEGYPNVIRNFSLDESGKTVPDSVAKVNADNYLRDTLRMGIVSPCPFRLPKSNSLKDVFDFVSKLDENILAKGMDTLIFFTTNVAITAANSKKAMKKIEGFITMCTKTEISVKDIVPLQCIPADVMKGTEQKEIEEVDRFDMEQRVSQKEQIAKKLSRMVKLMKDFQKEYAEDSAEMARQTNKKIQSLKSDLEFWKVNAFASEDKKEEKKMEIESLIDKKNTELQTYSYGAMFAGFSMSNLVKKYDQVQKEVNEAKDTAESGIPGVPKN